MEGGGEEEEEEDDDLRQAIDDFSSKTSNQKGKVFHMAEPP